MTRAELQAAVDAFEKKASDAHYTKKVASRVRRIVADELEAIAGLAVYSYEAHREGKKKRDAARAGVVA